MRAKRLFVSLDLPAAISDALVRLDPQLPGVRWLTAEQMHLTLAFFGEVALEREQQLQANLRAVRFTRFFLPLSGLGTFPAKGPPRIIWIGVGRGHPHLFQLHKLVTDAALSAGIEPDLRPWHPHITLARCQGISAQTIRPFLQKHAGIDLGMTPIDSFHLKSSQLTPSGSIHTIELTVPA